MSAAVATASGHSTRSRRPKSIFGIGIVAVVAALPKTRSGKILRKTMRDLADGKPVNVPSTIEDPDVIDALKPILSGDAGADVA